VSGPRDDAWGAFLDRMLALLTSCAVSRTVQMGSFSPVQTAFGRALISFSLVVASPRGSWLARESRVDRI
jgi:hypothetical protein